MRLVGLSGRFGTVCWCMFSNTSHAVWPSVVFFDGKRDNDNDNDTVREVPHPSNEGLALQARV